MKKIREFVTFESHRSFNWQSVCGNLFGMYNEEKKIKLTWHAMQRQEGFHLTKKMN